MRDGWLENAAGGAGRALDVRELAGHREVARYLALRDVQLRYKQTAIGVAWAVLQPLLGALLFTVVFGRVVGVPSDGLPYAVFAFSGLIGWTLLSFGVNEAATSLIDNESLVTKIWFPRLLAPLAAVLPGLLDLAVALPVLAVLMAVNGVAPDLALLTAPLWVAALALLAFGAGAGLAAFTVRYRDVRHALPFALQTWLFVTPVVYPSSLADGTLRWLLHLNPATAPIDGLRWALVGGPAPDAPDLLSAAVGLLAVAAGLAYFARRERTFADVI